MSNSKENKNDGSLPNAIVNQVIEHTVGGFVLFYFNQNTGEPEQVIVLDSPVHSLALQKHISDWSEAIHKLNIHNSIQSICQGVENEIQERDEEDE